MKNAHPFGVCVCFEPCFVTRGAFDRMGWNVPLYFSFLKGSFLSDCMRRRTNACLPGARQYDQYFRQQGQGQQAQSIVSLRKKARRSKLSRSVERHVKYVGLSVVFTEGANDA